MNNAAATQVLSPVSHTDLISEEVASVLHAIRETSQLTYEQRLGNNHALRYYADAVKSVLVNYYRCPESDASIWVQQEIDALETFLQDNTPINVAANAVLLGNSSIGF